GQVGRKFLVSWYKQFKWLEYSNSTHTAFCLPCFCFANHSPFVGTNVFVVGGFKSWKKVNDGKNCALLHHEGIGPNSPHKVALKSSYVLL
ncbi:hypothetical protein PSY81_23475, partial [Shigella flexneri]|nr:hypothetical protein [Shigella flexneri]